MTGLESSKLETVGWYSDEFSANLAKSWLDEAGFESMISRDDCGGQRPHLDVGGRIRLLVREEDAAEAREVLASIGPQTGEDA